MTKSACALMAAVLGLLAVPAYAQDTSPSAMDLRDPPSVVDELRADSQAGSAGSGGTFRALVTSPRRAILSAGLTGLILDMPVMPGNAFAKDDVLVQFDCAPHEANVKGAQAALRGARAEANAKERMAALQSIGRSEVEVARAAAAVAEADLASAKIVADYCQVTAPFAGHVVSFEAHPYETVQQGQPIIQVIGDAYLEIETIVPSRWLSWLKVGSPLTVTIDETGHTITTEVIRIGAEVDPASQSVVVTAAVPEAFLPQPQAPDQQAQPSAPSPADRSSIRLRAGMSGTVSFEPKP